MIVGTIDIFAFAAAPVDCCMLCQGQTLQVDANQIIFSVIRNQFGGDGVTTFCLPDLQGRTPVGMLQNGSDLGVKSGKEAANVSPNAMPAHRHHIDMNQTIRIETSTTYANPAITSPVNNSLACASTVNGAMYSPNATIGCFLGDAYISPNTSISGNGTSVAIRNPYACVNYSIVIKGNYPERE